MGVQVNSIALRYRKMMEKKASNLEGNVQVGMNFNSMMENMKAKAGEYVTLFGTLGLCMMISSAFISSI